MVANSGPALETREVVCTHCDRPIAIPATAMSVSCRHCHQRVIIEDVKIKSYHAVVRLATAGRVEVGKKAQVVAQLRVNELVVHGKVKGDVVALGLVSISKRASVVGDVSCRALAIESGAELSGFYRVDPSFVPKTAPAAEDDDEFA